MGLIDLISCVSVDNEVDVGVREKCQFARTIYPAMSTSVLIFLISFCNHTCGTSCLRGINAAIAAPFYTAVHKL